MKRGQKKAADYYRRKIIKAVKLAAAYGQIDGGHHKAWVIDQMLRVLLGRDYKGFVVAMRNGEDGPDSYSYDEGIAP